MHSLNFILYVTSLMLLADTRPIHSSCRIAIPAFPTIKCSNATQEQFEEAVFVHKTKLVKWIITNNVNFTDIPNVQLWLKNVETIHIENNFANLNLNTFKNFQKLRYLNVMYGDISEYSGIDLLNTSLAGWPIHQSFTHCKIQSIRSLCPDIPYDQDLYLKLNNNNIGYFNKSTIGHCNYFTNLKELILHHNYLKRFYTDVFLILKKLRLIDLSFNQIFVLENNYKPEFIVDAISVEHFYLGHNNLVKLTLDTFKYFSNLTNLYLEHNEIKYIHNETFESLIKLKVLNLSMNLINILDPRVISPLHNLQNLDISYNELVEFRINNTNVTLRYMNVSGNPWRCDELSSLLQFLNNKRVKFTTDANMNNNTISKRHGIRCKEVQYEIGRIDSYVSKVESEMKQYDDDVNKMCDEAVGDEGAIRELKMTTNLMLSALVICSCVAIITVVLLLRSCTPQHTNTTNRGPADRKNEHIYEYATSAGVC